MARWISIYGEDAKEEIAGIRAELVDRLGEQRAARVADTNRNLVIFPNLVINDGSSVTKRRVDEINTIIYACQKALQKLNPEQYGKPVRVMRTGFVHRLER